jgi:phosphate transport system permease protein
MNLKTKNIFSISPKPAVSLITRASASLRWDLALIPILNLVTGFIGLFIAAWMMIENSLEKGAIPMLAVISMASLLLMLDVYRQKRKWDIQIGVLAGVSYIFIVLLMLIPEYVSFLNLNAVFHRSFWGSIFIMVASMVILSRSLFYLNGATPRAEDVSHYPLLLVPIGLVLVVYIALIIELAIKGLPGMQWSIISKEHLDYFMPKIITVAGDWPKYSVEEIRNNVGLLNYIEGTGLLVLIAALISVPIGVGSGIFLGEYSEGWLGSITRFVITALRSTSLLVMALLGFSFITLTKDTPFASIFIGYYFNGVGMSLNNGGNFITAGLMLSFLIIPIIARAVEEGCRSLPLELREGSIALGAPEETTLWKIVLPWVIPNLITGILLGCAEAAGDITIIMFFAGRGDFGVSFTSQVTSLAYLIFYAIASGDLSFKPMVPYAYTAGLILMMITVGLGVIAMISKRWLATRFRGG